MTILQLANAQLESIVGIESAKKLKSITLNDNSVNKEKFLQSNSVLQGFSNLDGLENLNLSGLGLEDRHMKVLGTLEHVTSLNLNNNQISKLGELSNIETLTGLQLKNNSLVEIDGVSKLIHLKNFDISNTEEQLDLNGIKDYSEHTAFKENGSFFQADRNTPISEFNLNIEDNIAYIDLTEYKPARMYHDLQMEFLHAQDKIVYDDAKYNEKKQRIEIPIDKLSDFYEPTKIFELRMVDPITGTVYSDQSYIYGFHKPVKGGDITIKYVDEDDNPIEDEEVLTGNINEEYISNAKEIFGYILNEEPFNATGIFKEEAQTVIYKYTRSPGGDVTVNYVDEDGNLISNEEILSGNIGETYNSEEKDIQGYTLKEKPSNASGKFTDEQQTVVYVYGKDKEIIIDLNNSDNGDNSVGESEGDGESENSKIEKSNTLPKTSTNNFNLLLVGILLFLGGTIYMIARKKGTN